MKDLSVIFVVPRNNLVNYHRNYAEYCIAYIQHWAGNMGYSIVNVLDVESYDKAIRCVFKTPCLILEMPVDIQKILRNYNGGTEFFRATPETFYHYRFARTNVWYAGTTERYPKQTYDTTEYDHIVTTAGSLGFLYLSYTYNLKQGSTIYLTDSSAIALHYAYHIHKEWNPNDCTYKEYVRYLQDTDPNLANYIVAHSDKHLDWEDEYMSNLDNFKEWFNQVFLTYHFEPVVIDYFIPEQIDDLLSLISSRNDTCGLWSLSNIFFYEPTCIQFNQAYRENANNTLREKLGDRTLIKTKLFKSDLVQEFSWNTT